MAFSLLTLLAILSGCTSAPPVKSGIGQLIDHDLENIDQSLATRIMSENAPYKSHTQIKFEDEIQRKVKWWMHYFTTTDRERFARNFERGENYRTMIQQILADYQLPPELYYLAMVESGFVNHATSSTKAIGIWQFMDGTAHHFGLKLKGGFDERKDPIAATHAAAHYLTYLHQQFGSWYLAIAAYNAGQGRIRKAIREGKSHDFWRLVEEGKIPRETMDYIPKFLAATSIGSHYEAFGFTSKAASNPWPVVERVQIKSGMKLKAIAEKANVSESALLRLNPTLTSLLKTNHSASLRIWVPRDSAVRFALK